MQYPILQEEPKKRTMTQEFTGYNHNLRISEGECYNMLNMSCDNYPILSTREERQFVEDIKIYKPNGMISKDALLYIDGDRMYYNSKQVDLLKNGLSLTDSEKVLISMGAYVIIFPDKIMYNTQTGEAQYMEHKYTSTKGDAITFSLCDIDGNDIDAVLSGNTPENPANGQFWMDVSSGKPSLKQFSETSSMWIQVPSVYIKITATGIGKGFKQFDGVKVSGCTAANTGALNNTSVIWKKENDYIVIVGILEETVSQTDPITVEKRIPEFDFACESNNRLWLCHYGIVNGKPVNGIYASKLGDPTNFQCFMGVSTDSYAVSLGSDGVFTGAIAYGGYPIFFKENCIHKIYGTIPANFQVQTTAARGVQKGSEKSLQVVNEILYYKSPTDICAYNGSLPQTVSEKLGTIAYRNAVAGSLNGKYYISMEYINSTTSFVDDRLETYLFCYDTSNGIWTKEDQVRAKFFCRLDDNNLLFYNTSEGRYRDLSDSYRQYHNKIGLHSITHLDTVVSAHIGSGNKEYGSRQEMGFPWYFESGYLGFSDPDNKYIGRFSIRLMIEDDAPVTMYIEYDGSERWEEVNYFRKLDETAITIQVPLRRCDYFRFKLEGSAPCKIISITKTYTKGSDLKCRRL